VALNQYLKTVEKDLAAGYATEHTHRPVLKALVESLAETIRLMAEIDSEIEERDVSRRWNALCTRSLRDQRYFQLLSSIRV
jgi:hypothetical protein